MPTSRSVLSRFAEAAVTRADINNHPAARLALQTISEAYIASCLKTLFEQKDFYQWVDLDKDKLAELCAIPSKFWEPLAWAGTQVPSSFGEAWRITALGDARTPVKELHIGLPTCRLYCQKCDGPELHSLFSSARVDGARPFFGCNEFLVALKCVYCSTEPVVFLLVHRGTRIQLAGRFPIDKRIAPASVPPRVRRFFEKAIMQAMCGEHLAALFFLRTVIEQHARDVTKDRVTRIVDEVMQAYAATLPLKVREFAPSFSDIYNRLSVKIHNARAAPEDYSELQQMIVRHFNAVRDGGPLAPTQAPAPPVSSGG